MDRGIEPRTPEGHIEWLEVAPCALMVGLLMAGAAMLMGLSPSDVWAISVLGGLGAVPYILAIGAKR